MTGTGNLHPTKTYRDRLNILFVTPRFPPFMGGVETHTFEVGRRMAAKGHSIRVLTGDLTGELPRNEVAAGMSVSRVAVYPKSSDMYFAPGIFGQILRAQADLVHIQGFHSFVPPVAALAAIMASTPFVLTIHSGGHSSRLRNAVRGAQCAVFSPLLSRARQLIAVSEFEAGLFSKRLGIGRERFIVAPNGAEIETPPSVEPTDQKSPLIVSVGRLERYKGHQRVIAAFAEFKKVRPGAKLRICGEGPYKPELEKLVGEHGLRESVVVAGLPPAERKRMGALLARASLVVLLSDYEAHPIAALEAISAGRPVLASHTTGFAEMAEKGLLRGVDPRAGPRAHAEAMLELLEAPIVRRAPKGLIIDWDECANHLLGVYHDALARPQGTEPQGARAPA